MISVYASQPHYWHHLAPVWWALPAEARAAAVAGSGSALAAAEEYGIPATRGLPDLGPRVLVAGGADAMLLAGRHDVAHLDHGAGQTYYGDPSHPVDSHGYAGGGGLERVRLFLTASERVARQWAARYPEALVRAVGPCALGLGITPEPRVCITFHWANSLVAEAGTAWHDWHGALEPLAEAVPLIGHWHPRWGRRLERIYRSLGIEPVAWWPDVLRQASVLIADNTSALYEWAAVGRRVIALNAAAWRPAVHHGLRFWHAIPGPALWPGEAYRLPMLARQALESPSWEADGAAAGAVSTAYGPLADGNGPQRAAQVLLEWAA